MSIEQLYEDQKSGRLLAERRTLIKALAEPQFRAALND